ncbi:hypothetical protein GCM10022409_26450 [Hymenobacter glaciei]|uniref:Uncharacterized protein n=1 Tax=Hymenobacter glaciei TaxID=877209 RepID=A0ABP7UB49_9BACT
MLKYCFETRNLLGRSNHFITTGAPYEMLGNISSSYLSQPSEVMKLMKNLEQVMAGTKEGYPWGEDDCAFSSEPNLTYIDYDFGDHTITIPTSEILQLMRDWLKYLQQQA